MRLEFKATDGDFVDEDDPSYCLVFSVSGYDTDGVEHYLSFQRNFEDEDPADDCGIHFEFDDQSQGAFNCVSRCRMNRTTLEVELSRSIDRRKKYTAVYVDMSALEDATVDELQSGLLLIFREYEAIIELD